MAQVSFRIDDNLKKRAENACADMGMTMSAAITVFLTKVANERRIPFEISAAPASMTDEEQIDEAAARIMEKYRPAFLELAK